MEQTDSSFVIDATVDALNRKRRKQDNNRTPQLHRSRQQRSLKVRTLFLHESSLLPNLATFLCYLDHQSRPSLPKLPLFLSSPFHPNFLRANCKMRLVSLPKLLFSGRTLPVSRTTHLINRWIYLFMEPTRRNIVLSRHYSLRLWRRALLLLSSTCHQDLPRQTLHP